MDNTNLVATSHEGLNNMLRISQEFFGYNNTKINFNKAVLICNRDPHDPLLPLSNINETAAVSFLANTPYKFSIKPIKPNEAFRFLGVWFNINTTRQQTLKLCKADYSLFCKTHYNKKLTIKQLTYLHNAVLLPKVEFKLKTYMPSASDCYRISSSFRKTFRKIIGFSCAIPNHFLQFPHSFNLIDLHQRCVTNNINSFYRNFIEDPLDSFPIDIRKSISHRLSEIQRYFNLPFSPLFLDNFDSFKNCKRFKDDYILQIIYHASLINIRFAKPQYTNPQDFIHTPIHYLFTNNPSLYAKSLPLLRKHNITFLSDCINDEQTSLLPYRDIIIKNSFFPPGKIPRWFKYISQRTAAHPLSLQLADQYKYNDTSTTSALNLSIDNIIIRPPPNHVKNLTGVPLRTLLIPKSSLPKCCITQIK